MDNSRRIPATQLINGEVLSVYHNPTLYQQALDFEPEVGDIIEVTYTRSGTHLVQQMIQLIVNSGRSTQTFAEFTERAPFLEVQGPQETEAPRLLRTHIPMHRLRLSDKAKYVYVARNPWDCCVSNFHLMKDLPGFEFADGSFDDFLDVFLEGQFGFGDYFDHVNSGFRHRRDANVFFVTYEEIARNKADVVLKLAHFLGKGYGEMVESSSEILKLILEKSGIDFMKNLLETNESDMARVFRSGAVSTNARGKTSDSPKMAKYSFVRKGAVGDGSSYFSQENTQKMQEKIDEKFRDTDIMGLWRA
ncbi:unnamed protein product [Ixodes hexagonus]